MCSYPTLMKDRMMQMEKIHFVMSKETAGWISEDHLLKASRLTAVNVSTAYTAVDKMSEKYRYPYAKYVKALPDLKSFNCYSRRNCQSQRTAPVSGIASNEYSRYSPTSAQGEPERSVCGGSCNPSCVWFVTPVTKVQWILSEKKKRTVDPVGKK